MSEKNISSEKKVSPKNLAHDALHDLIHFDTKFLRTVPLLLFKPGVLAREATTNNENKYVKPFALFVFLNFVFFIFKSKGIFEYTLETYRGFSWFASYFSQKQNELKLPPGFLAERFNTAMHFEQKEYLIIMVPLFAMVLYLLYFMKKRHFAEHLVFAVYFYCFFIVCLIILPYLFILLGLSFDVLGGDKTWLNSEDVLIGAVLLLNWTYLFFGVRTVYPGGYFAAAYKSMVLSFTTILLITFVYKLALFFIVMHGIAE